MTTFIFTVFYNFIFLYGRGFLILLEKILGTHLINKKISGIKIVIFSPLIFLFFLGNLAFIANFFIPTKFLIYVVAPLIFLNLFKIEQIKLNPNYVFNLLIIPLILGFSSFDIGLHFDAGLYHLNFQNWLRESNLVLGITNIYSPYGWSSINEYISSLFWIEDNFILLHFVQLIFLTQLFTFLFSNLTNKENHLKFPSYLILLFGVLDNFGVDGGRNGFYSIQSIGKFDTNFGILFLIFSLFILNQINNKDYSRSDLTFFSFLLVFCIQMKLTGLVCGILYLIYVYKFSKFHQDSFFSIFKQIKLPSLLGFLWILKNVLQSGCLFFTLEFTCFPNLSWYQSGYANALKITTNEFNNAFLFNMSIFAWFQEWYSVEINRTHILNLIISISLILLFKYFFFNLKKYNKTILFIGLFFILLKSIVWIIGAPDPRFAHGLFTLIVGFIGFNISGFKKYKFEINKKYLFYTVFFTCLILTPRINSYKSSLDSFFEFISVNIPNVEYVSSEFWGEIPVNEECWVNLDCNRFNKDISKNNISFFTIFVD